MKTNRLLALAAFAVVCLSGQPHAVKADDAEIYVDLRPPESSQPLVMFSLDTRANMGSAVCQGSECDFLRGPNGPLPASGSVTYGELLAAAIVYTLRSLEGLKVGIMFSHDYQMTGQCRAGDPSTTRCSNGGYIAMGFRPLGMHGGVDTAEMLGSVIRTIPSDNNFEHSYQGTELFYEFHRYLKGMDVWNGKFGFTSYDHGSAGRDTNISPQYEDRWLGTESAEIHGFSWDPTIIIEGSSTLLNSAQGTYSHSGRYKSPLDEIDDCAKIFTVNLMFGLSQQDTNSNAEIQRTNNLPTQCSGAPTGATGTNCPAWRMIGHLNDVDHAPDIPGRQNVISYFLTPSSAPPGRISTMNRYAEAGGTNAAYQFDSDNPAELVDILGEIFKQILSVSTTFTAGALPVNTFDRSEVLDNVYLALFQPQTEQFPTNKYWWGNVKKLRLSGLTPPYGDVGLVDAREQNAVALDGRLRFDALTFWTDALGFDVQDPSRDPDENAVAGSDGRSVNRGGSGQRIPGFLDGEPGLTNAAGPRRMYYDTGPNSLAALDATTALAESLQSTIGAASEAEALEVLRFLRGYQPGSEFALNWMFGSAMHSRPLPVNYGARGDHSRENPLIYIAVGGNDGALRFIRNTDESGNELGREVWSFVPTEVMGNMRRIVDISATTRLGETTIYGFDGPPSLYVSGDTDGTVGATEDVVLYAGLRRGGKGYYALDISNPESPSLKWRIVGGVGGDDGFEDLALTFSQPRVGQVNIGGEAGIRPVVIFGGGYDRVYDERGAIPADGSVKGKGIYIVDGLTGKLHKHLVHADMLDSIAATVTPVDTSRDGVIDRVYAGDLGGRVWRFDLTPAGNPAQWTVSLLADLGRHAAGDAAGSASDRRFFNAPDVVQSKQIYGSDNPGEATLVEFDAVLIGSGDRENPLETVQENYFFMIRDPNTGVLSDSEDTAFKLSDLVDVTENTGVPLESTANGWALQFDPAEKNLAPAITLSNVVYFTTYLPASGAAAPECGPAEGSGRVYAVSLHNANPPPMRDAPINDLDSEVKPEQRWSDLKSGGIPAEVVLIPQIGRVMLPDFDFLNPPFSTKWRTYWHVQEDPIQ